MKLTIFCSQNSAQFLKTLINVQNCSSILEHLPSLLSIQCILNWKQSHKILLKYTGLGLEYIKYGTHLTGLLWPLYNFHKSISRWTNERNILKYSGWIGRMYIQHSTKCQIMWLNVTPHYSQWAVSGCDRLCLNKLQ